jgi:hypothetical protein
MEAGMLAASGAAATTEQMAARKRALLNLMARFPRIREKGHAPSMPSF